MSAPFQRSLRSLETQEPWRIGWSLATAVVFAVAWGIWFTNAKVSVYAVTPTARVEVDRAAHPVHAAVSGRVVSVRLGLARTVAAGEPLVELDSEELRLELAEKNARLAGLSPQLAAIEKELRARRAERSDRQRAADAQVAEARARLTQEQARLAFLEGEADRTRRLHEMGAVSKTEFERMRSDREAHRASAAAQDIAIGRIDAEVVAEALTLQGTIADLERTREDLRSQRLVLEASLAATAHAIELRTIRAPIAGQLGEISQLQVGTMLQYGDQVAAVVPRSELRVVAAFTPAIAIGRVRLEQAAKLRLDGFSWVQFGTVPLVVSGVGSELREGKVRVELRIVGDSPPMIPLQHGLPGMVEIAVEQVTPFVLVTRAVGRILEQDASAIE